MTVTSHLYIFVLIAHLEVRQGHREFAADGNLSKQALDHGLDGRGLDAVGAKIGGDVGKGVKVAWVAGSNGNKWDAEVSECVDKISLAWIVYGIDGRGDEESIILRLYAVGTRSNLGNSGRTLVGGIENGGKERGFVLGIVGYGPDHDA